jgi:hypothetical protein
MVLKELSRVQVQNRRQAESVAPEDQGAFSPQAAALAHIAMNNRHVPTDRAHTDARHGEKDIERGPQNVTRSAGIDRDVIRHSRVGAGRLHQIIGDPSHAAARLSRRSHEKAAAPFGTELRRTARVDPGAPVPQRRCSRSWVPADGSTEKLRSTHGGFHYAPTGKTIELKDGETEVGNR